MTKFKTGMVCENCEVLACLDFMDQWIVMVPKCREFRLLKANTLEILLFSRLLLDLKLALLPEINMASHLKLWIKYDLDISKGDYKIRLYQISAVKTRSLRFIGLNPIPKVFLYFIYNHHYQWHLRWIVELKTTTQSYSIRHPVGLQKLKTAKAKVYYKECTNGITKVQ